MYSFCCKYNIYIRGNLVPEQNVFIQKGPHCQQYAVIAAGNIRKRMAGGYCVALA